MVVKHPPANAGDPGSFTGLGRFPPPPPEKGMATHSSITASENPLDRGAWWATVHGGTVHGLAKS